MFARGVSVCSSSQRRVVGVIASAKPAVCHGDGAGGAGRKCGNIRFARVVGRPLRWPPTLLHSSPPWRGTESAPTSGQDLRRATLRVFSNRFVILSAAKNPAGGTCRFRGAEIQVDSSLRSE